MKKNLFLLFILIIFLSNCYKQTIIIDNYLAKGSVVYNIEYYNEFNNFLSYVVNNKNISLKTSLLFNKDEINTIVENEEGLELLFNTITNSKSSIISNTKFNLTDLNNNYDFLPLFYFKNSMYKENNINYFKTSLDINKDKVIDIFELYNNISEEDINTLDSYLSMIKMEFNYIFKTGIIIQSNMGKISNDKKSLTFNTTLNDLLKFKKKPEIIFSYTKN